MIAKTGPGPLDNPGLPEGWLAEIDGDGTLRLSEWRQHRRLRGAGMLCVAILFSVPPLLPGPNTSAPWLRILTFTVTAGVGIGLAAWGFWLVLGREEWRASPGHFARSRQACGWVWEHRCDAGAFYLLRDADGNIHLLMQCPGGRLTALMHGTPERAASVHTMGELLATQTTWRLRETGDDLPSEARDA